MNSPQSGDHLYQPMGRTQGKVPPTPAGKCSVKPKTRAVQLVPDVVNCEGTTTVSVVFNPIPEALSSAAARRIEVSVRSRNKTDRITATEVAPGVFYFTAPENREGEATVVVFVNGVELATSHLHYRSETLHLMTGLSQIHLQLMSLLCRFIYQLQTEHRFPSHIPKLDRCLSEWFSDKTESTRISAKTFEELFDFFRHSSHDVIRSEYEVPTLLHFAAEFGFDELASKLLDLPGSSRACNVFNARGSRAGEIARNNGHAQLSMRLSKTDDKSGPPIQRRQTELCNQQARKCKADTLLPPDFEDAAPGVIGDYVTQDVYATPTDFHDNYTVLSQQELQEQIDRARATLQREDSSRKEPPKPCAASLARSNTHPTDTTRYEATGPPIVPRRESRESRDSGVHVDGSEPTTPVPMSRGFRPPLSRNESASSSSGSSKSYTPHDIARQLSATVPPNTMPKGQSRTK